MSELTIEEMKQKIERVKEDIESLRSSGDASRRIEILTEYKSYLEDELEMIKREQRTAK